MEIRAGSLVLHRERCKRCGICIELCPMQVYVSSAEGYPEPVNVEECTSCGLCELWCPDYAIEVEVKDE